MKLVNIRPDIYSFVDSRKYLWTFYTENKKANPAFSLRAFGQMAGVKSYNYLSLIIDGKRRLTGTFLEPFAKALRLDSQEKIYFSHMIDFTEADDPAKKRDHFRLLMAARPTSILAAYDKSQLVLCEEWFYIAIIELTEAIDFQDDSSWIAERLGIKKAQVETAIKKMMDVKLLERTGARLKKTYIIADTPDKKRDDFGDQMINQYHHRNLVKASELVFEFEPHERELGSITAVLDPEQFQALKQKIKEFRKQVFGILERPPLKGEDVYQLNFQLLPVTKPRRSQV